MLKLNSYASKIRNRIKQEDVLEENPNSLSAKAFRRRILDDNFSEPTLASGGLLSETVQTNQVATYQPGRSPFLRTLLKISLVFILPVLALALIVWIVVGIIQEGAANARPIETDTLVIDNIPIPAGARPIARNNKAAQFSIAEANILRVLPNYHILKHVGAATFISPKSVQELQSYYEDKLIKTKAWQTYGNTGNGGVITLKLYLKGLASNVPNSLEAVLISLEKIDPTVLRDDPQYYDRQTKLSETVIVVTKTWVAPR